MGEFVRPMWPDALRCQGARSAGARIWNPTRRCIYRWKHVINGMRYCSVHARGLLPIGAPGRYIHKSEQPMSERYAGEFYERF